MDKYDGWTIKVLWHTHPWLLTTFFRKKRTDVIKAYEKQWNEKWRKDRERGNFKIVKVKLIEVE